MADAIQPSFKSERIKAGDTWSNIAYTEWGDANKFRDLIYDNPHLPLNSPLPAGEIIWIRILDTPTTGTPLPPWFVDEDTLNETLGETDTGSIPVVEGPPVPLGFSPGYPKVEGNRIAFALNKSTRLTYSVEKQAGGVIAESSGYDFAAGFPVFTSDIVEGGRYIVKVGNLVSGPLTVVGSAAPLAFVQIPVVVKEGNVWKLRFSINKTGAYDTYVVNNSTTLEVYRQNGFDYLKDFVYTINITLVGAYTLHVNGLTYVFTVQEETEITELPSWLTGIGFRYDANSHDLTKYIDATEDTEVKISLPSGNGPSGINQDGVIWNALTYNPGRSDGVPTGYDERFSFNPTSFSAGGLLPGTTYKGWVRRAANRSEIFTYVFTTPTVSTAPGVIEEVDLEEPEDLPACGRRPTILQIFSPTSTGLRFLFDGMGVYSMKWKVRESVSNNIVRQATVIVALDNGTPVFSPSNQPIISYATLTDGDYILEIEGNNCSSTPHTMAFTIDDGVIVIPPDQDEIELATYYDDSGTADLKCRVIGAFPITIQVFDETDDEVFSDTKSSNEIEIPDAVVTALGTQTMRIVATDDDGKVATRYMSKIVRNRRSRVHAFLSVTNGNTTNHMDAITQGQSHTPPLTMTGVIFGELATDAAYNAYKNSTYIPGGASPYDFDNVIYLASQQTDCNLLKVGVLLNVSNGALNNGTSRTLSLSVQDMVMRPGGVTPVEIPWLIAQMTPSPSSTNARAFGKRRAEAFVRHNYGPIMAGTVALIGFPISVNGEAEYPFGYHNNVGADEGTRAHGDFHPQGVAKFKLRYPQHTGVTDQQLYDQFDSNNALALDWKEHLALEYAEFEAETFDHIYSIYPEMRLCQFEQIDVGSDTDLLAPYRHTLNIRRRIRKTTGIMKTNDNTYAGQDNRMRFIMDHDTSLSRIYGSDFAAEPSPPNPNFADAGVRAEVLAMVEKMYDRGAWWSFFDHNFTNVQYLLDNSSFVPGALPKAKQEFEISGSNKILHRLTRNVSDIFKTGAFGGWEAAWSAFKTSESLTHVDTLSFDDLYTGAGPGPGPDPDPDPEPGSGEWVPTIAHYGLDSLLHVTVTDAGSTATENWLINMTTSVVKEGGKTFWIIFEDTIYKNDNLPTNYPYQSNEPISIELYSVIAGTDTLYRWANPGEDRYIPGFSNQNQGQTLDLNSTAAIVVIGFQEA